MNHFLISSKVKFSLLMFILSCCLFETIAFSQSYIFSATYLGVNTLQLAGRIEGDKTYTLETINPIDGYATTAQADVMITVPQMLTQLSLSADCTSGTADLSAITASNQPANTTLTWHSATPVSNANAIVDVAALNPGTYYAAFYHAGDDCYADNDLTVTVTAACCLDNICPATTVDLTAAISAMNTPSGAILSYHTGIPVTAANEIADPTSVNPGSYFIAFKNENSNCYAADGMEATEVIVNPITTCDPLSNVCPETTVNLNTAFTVDNLPPGTTLEWHTIASPVDNTTLVADPTAVDANTYYAVFYDATAMCYSDNSTAVVVDIVACSTITAVDDDFTGSPVASGGTTPTVFTNDDAGGTSPATDALVTTPTIISDGGLTGVTFNSDGTANVPVSAGSGTYTITYEICLEANNSICDQADVMITVSETTVQLSLSADCTSGTADLSAITASNQPANTTLTWHSATPVSNANAIADVAALNPGTYYAAFYHTGADCYADNTLTVAVTAACCLDNICPATTVDLTAAISAMNTPLGAILSYHTGIPVTAANEIADPTSVNPGSYFIAFKNENSNCYAADGMEATEVIVNPTTTCDPLSNVCPETTVNLNTAFTVDNLPSGTTLEWHTIASPVDNTTLVADPTAVDANTYYAVFYDATAMCYSDNSTAVVVDIVACSTITAVDDDFTGSPVASGGTTPTVFTNDDAGGTSPATDALVTTPTIISDGGLTGVTFNSDGTANVPVSASLGTYTITYEICLEANNSICDQADVMITVSETTVQLSLSADCTSGTADLSAITASNQPANTTLTWHSATPVSNANAIADVAALNPGIYYAAFYHTGADCYADNTLTVAVTAACCLDNICPATTVDLTAAISAMNTPLGAILSYHTGIPVTAANEIADPTSVNSGSYFIAFKNENSNCYAADGMEATEVIVNPTTTCDPLSNVCPETTVNLNTAFTVDNLPSGTTLEWHTIASPVDNTTLVADPTAVDANTYYAVFYDATAMCYSDNSTAVVVDIVACSTITAVDDDFTGSPVASGGTTPTVFTNDDADGTSPATDALVTTPTVISDGGLTGVTFNSDGTANVPVSASSGTYTITYEICLEANNSICDQADVMITILACPTLAVTSSNPTICNSSDGSIFLTLTNVPDGTYTINYMDDMSNAQTFTDVVVLGGSATISGLSAGTYNDLTITVLGCTSTENVYLSLKDGLNITTSYSENCIESSPNNFTADWKIGIEVFNTSETDISYQRNSETIQSHTLTGTTDTLTISNIPADGGAYDTLKVWFTNDMTCADTIILKRPLPCPSSIGGCTNTTTLSRICSSYGEEDADSTFTDVGSSDLELVNDSGTGSGNQTVGILYPTVDIPIGATITNAYIQFEVDEVNNINPVLLTINGEATDDADPYTSNANEISGRNTTTNSISWSPNDWTTIGDKGIDQQTPDLSAIIQEIVDRPGWNLGQNLAFIITGSGKRVAETNPSLYITYQIVGDCTPESICNTVAANDIAGSVWEDFNYNGQIDETYVTGVQGVSVFLFDCDNNLIDTAYTNVNGSYQFTGLTSGANYRVEFVLPESVSCWAKPTQAGTDNGTTVQFAQPGTCVSLGVSNPADYCENSPILMTPCYVNGEALGGTTAGVLDAFVGVPANFTGTGVNGSDNNYLADVEQIGSTWGVAVQPSTRTIFTSSVLKRHASFGPANNTPGTTDHTTGGIYAIDYSNPGSPSVSLWLDLNALPNTSTGTDPHSGLNGTPTQPTHDSLAFAQVGKIALGDLDISEDGKTLYAMNLNERTLIAIDTETKTVLNQYSIPNPGCTNSDNTIEAVYHFTNTSGTIEGKGHSWQSGTSRLSGVAGNISGGALVDFNPTDAPQNLFANPVFGDNLSLPLAVDNGTYEVSLYFRDYGNGIGARVFDISLEGLVVADDFDIEADNTAKWDYLNLNTSGGGNGNYNNFGWVGNEQTFTVTVTDGTLNINLDRVSGFSTLLSAIKVKNTTTSPLSANDYRPWGIGIEKGKIYVGLVCSAETSGMADDLTASVLELHGNSFTEVLSFPLDYDRSFGSRGPNNPELSAAWNAWSDDASYATWDGNFGLTFANLSHSQPILSDIEFDSEGNMIVGFLDRGAHQVGYANYTPTNGSTVLEFTYSAGDVLKACREGSQWFIEGESSCAQNYTGITNHIGYQGINGGEYFGEDYAVTGASGNVHDETHWGGLVFMKNTNQLVNTAMSPRADFSSGGLTWYDNNTGGYVQGYEVYGNTEDNGTQPQLFGKANGLGDVALLCEPAPLEIGNYVWNDKDNDGIQDACESGIAGVNVSLFIKNGSDSCDSLTTVQTDANGQYYFNESTVGLDTLLTDTTYYIVIGGNAQWDMATDRLTINGSAYQLSTADQGSNNAIDSDGIEGTGTVTCMTGKVFTIVQTEGFGCVNHDADFGLYKCEINIQSVVSSNCTETSPNVFEAQWDVTIISDGYLGDISYRRNSESTATYSVSNCPDTTTVNILNIPADGGIYDTIYVFATNDNACADTIILKRPLPCPNETSGCLNTVTLSANTASYAEEDEDGTSTDTGSSDLELVRDASSGSGNQKVGILYSSINIPIGATITNAYIQFQVDEDDTGNPISLTIRGEATDNAVLFAPNPNEVSSRNTTTNSVNWVPNDWTTVGEIGPDQQTPDLSAIVQEIIDRPGWNPGQNLAFFITGTGERVAETNAVLNITFELQIDCPTESICSAISPSQIGGNVWEDINYNGQKDEMFINGIQGVSVFLYDCNNAIVDTAYTDVNGNYLFTGLTTGADYRVEFSLPEAVSCWAKPTQAGTDNGTTVQFAQPGACVHLGLSNPADYCETNPSLLTTCYANGDPADGTVSVDDALVSFNYDGTGKSGDVTIGQVGSVWGIAFDQQNQRYFVSTVLRRHSGIVDGLGAIYVANPTTATPTLFTTLSNVGTIASNTARGLSTLTAASQDQQAYSQIGKIGIGDMDISEDGSTLYVVNLNTKRVVAINTTTAAETELPAIPDPGCTNGEIRPWGLKIYRGDIYLGAVCSGENGGSDTDLSAYVFKYSNGSWTTLLSYSLDYDKGDGYRCDNGGCGVTGDDDWNPWYDDMSLPPATYRFDSSYFSYATPILSDLEFTENGSLLMGFIDRSGMQWGSNNYPPFNTTDLYGYTSGGEILIAHRLNGGLVMENNGNSGDPTGVNVGNSEGPGGGEFINDNYTHTADNDRHPERSFGSLALKKGSGEFMMTILAPRELDSGGIGWFNLDNGDFSRDLLIYNTDSQSDARIGKSIGLGDIELFCEPAPLEIGNYVWCDSIQNGIQDACERGINDIIVQLYDRNGLLVGQDSTSNSGQYYFNQNNVDTTGITIDGSGIASPVTAWSGLNYSTQYFIVFGGGQFAMDEFIIGNNIYEITSFADAGTNDNIDSDVDGSNLTSGSLGARPDGLPFIDMTTAAIGCGDHQYDLGIICSPCLNIDQLITTRTICSGDLIDTLAVTTRYPNPNSIAFVYFTNQQTDSSLIYTNGIGIDTMQITASNDTVSITEVSVPTFVNTGITPDTFYVYAIKTPLPVDITCRPYEEILVIINPAPIITASDTHGSSRETLPQMTTNIPDGIWTIISDIGTTDDGNGTITLGTNNSTTLNQDTIIYLVNGCTDSVFVTTRGVSILDDIYSTCPGLELSGQVASNDGIFTPFTVRAITNPTLGNLNLETDGNFTYNPTSSFCGIDSFYYEMTILNSGSKDTAKVSLQFTDDVLPTLQNVPANESIHCDEILPTPPLVSAFDNCPFISINATEMSTQGEDGCSLYDYTISRTWTVVDVCGNSTDATQLIEIKDITAPDIFRIYTLPNGKKMIAGVMENVTDRWKTVSLPIDFETTPLIFTQVVSTNETTPITVQLRNSSTQQFELRLQEEQQENGMHQEESVAWIAIEAGNQSALEGFPLEARFLNLSDTWQNISFEATYPSFPSIFAAMQTTLDADPSSLRFRFPTLNSIDLQIQEETSVDADVSHASEQIAFLGIEHGRHLLDRSENIFGETGSVSVDDNWTTVYTNHTYYNPVVIAGAPQSLDGDPGTVRVRNVTANSFEIHFEEWGYLDGNHALEFIPFLVMEGSLPLDTTIFCNEGTDGLEIGKDIIAIDNCDKNVELQYDETIIQDGAFDQIVRTWSSTDECGNHTGFSQIIPCAGVALQLKALLQGAVLGSAEPSLMRDDLRKKDLLPITEPYSSINAFKHIGSGGGETCPPSLFEITGTKAIVDWVFVSLLDSENSEEVIATHSALITRDGTILNEQGEAVIYFENVPPGNYHVSLRHRNHHPAITLHPYLFNRENIPFIDFTDRLLPTLGNHPFINVDNKHLMWSGDLNQDEKTIYQGPNNDIFFIFLQVLLDEENRQVLPNFINRAYTVNDFNLDGSTIYQGPNNDRSNLLYNTILKHPDNDTHLSNFTLSTKERVAIEDINDCLLDATLPYCDFDGDGKLNQIDVDDDNDGVIDGEDKNAYNPQSDTDGDGIKDIEEKELNSDPLNSCEPYQDHSPCLGQDLDNDGFYGNYPKGHNQFDNNDQDACIPNPQDRQCGCPDTDNDGYIIICHTSIDGNKQTLRVPLKQWRLRQIAGDVCGACF